MALSPLPTSLQSTTHCYGVLVGTLRFRSTIASRSFALKTFAGAFCAKRYLEDFTRRNPVLTFTLAPGMTT